VWVLRLFLPDPHNSTAFEATTVPQGQYSVDTVSEGLAQLAQLLSCEKLEVRSEPIFQPTQAADEGSTMGPPKPETGCLIHGG
jgi:hypothetical protein